MEVALEDDIISRDEYKILQIIRNHLKISGKMEEEIELKLRSKNVLKITPEEEKKLINSGDKDEDIKLYRKAVMQSLADFTVTQDEFKLLEGLRQVLGITEAEHVEIEKKIRDEIERNYSAPTAEKIYDRLATYLKMVKKHFI